MHAGRRFIRSLTPFAESRWEFLIARPLGRFLLELLLWRAGSAHLALSQFEDRVRRLPSQKCAAPALLVDRKLLRMGLFTETFLPEKRIPGWEARIALFKGTWASAFLRETSRETSYQGIR